MRVHTAEKP